MNETVEQKTWQAALARGDSSSALKSYLMLGEHEPAVLDALETLTTVRELLCAKRWSKARRRLEELEGPPAIVHWTALLEQVTVLEESSRLLDRRRPEEALEQLARADQPLLRAEASTQRGTAFVFMNELDQAAAAFAAALENDPRHYRALTNRGNLALERGDTDAAIADYEAALQISSDFSNALHNLGVAYRRKGQVGKSVQTIRKAQRALRREDSDDARDTLQALGQKSGRRWFRYALIAVVVVILFFILRGQGLF